MSDGELMVRAASERDLPEIARIVEAAYGVYLPRMDRKPFPMLDDYEGRLADGYLSVLELGGKVRGYIVLIPREDGALLLDNIGVDPLWQRRGLGKALLAFAEREAARLGLNRIAVYTNEAMTENIGWYQKFGYAVTDRRTENGYKRVYFEKILEARDNKEKEAENRI